MPKAIHRTMKTRILGVPLTVLDPTTPYTVGADDWIAEVNGDCVQIRKCGADVVTILPNSTQPPYLFRQGPDVSQYAPGLYWAIAQKGVHRAVREPVPVEIIENHGELAVVWRLSKYPLSLWHIVGAVAPPPVLEIVDTADNLKVEVPAVGIPGGKVL